MNSTSCEDFNPEYLAYKAAEYLLNISTRTKNIISLHKELLEVNLSVAAYIEESKNRLKALRLELANQATTSQKVVDILSKSSLLNLILLIIFQNKMSNLPKTPQKKRSHCKNIDISLREANNNSKCQLSKQQLARNFIAWYKSKIDNNLHNLSSYLSDDVTLEWFGRTIKTKKKVSGFMKTEIQCSQHDFTTVENIDRIQTRNEDLQRKDCTSILSPPQSPEINTHEILKLKKRKLQACRSPQWAEGCGPDEENGPHEKKRKISQLNDVKDVTVEISHKGDGVLDKSKNSSVTPPNVECGQGDCLPSTSGTNPETLRHILNPQLPKLAVECNGYVALTRTKHNWSVDSLKWDRKCKVQISYSDDPLNVGEYIIWNLRYSDESKCRRNLLSAFEEGASD